MTVATIRTKAEQALLRQFEEFAETSAGSLWATRRREAIGTIASVGLPSRRTEAWKYTDLRAHMAEAFAPLQPRSQVLDEVTVRSALGADLAAIEAVRIVINNGQFNGIFADALPHGVTVEALSSTMTEPSGEKLDDPAMALNMAFVTDGAVLRIAAGVKPPLPIHVIYLTDLAQPSAVTTRSLVTIEAGADVTLIESHVALGTAGRQTNHVTEIRVADAAKVRHLKLAGEGTQSTHLSTWLVDLGKNVDYFAFQLSLSPGLARNQAYVTYAGKETIATFNAAFLARGQEHVDTTLIIDHAVPHCTSRELVKGVLDGHARGVFQGKVIVRPDAQKSDGKQMAKSLMLSETAEFDSKPELEIYADDVVCGHGSTAAQIDDDHMFYLQARGIPAPQAKAMLVEAFVAEALDTIEHDGVRTAFQAMAARWLTAN
jgi:Fe-S cluster assembly protein SufD